MAVRKIGKTRLEQSYDPELGQPRGLLRRPPPPGSIRHARRAPPADLAPWIDHYWMVSWELPGPEPFQVESLPHPNAHLVLEPGCSVVHGIQTSRFSRLLSGSSNVFGIKFQPGGLRPFLGAPVASIADRLLPAKDVFGECVLALERICVSDAPELERIEAVGNFFRSRMPVPDPVIDRARTLVALVLENPAIKTVDDLARIAGLGKRSLQRIFGEYVGVSPKWVIRRYRLHELVAQLDSGRPLDWAQLALSLGYFDQSHMINDFRSIVGYSPTRYARSVATDQE